MTLICQIHYQIYIHFSIPPPLHKALECRLNIIKSFILNHSNCVKCTEKGDEISVLPSVGDDKLLRDKIKSSLCSSSEFMECFCSMSDARLQSLKLDV